MREQADPGPGAVAELLSALSSAGESRRPLGIPELDRVLGGGLVPGSAVLVAGEPGIGKSTLLLQASAAAARTLYVCGEETPEQVKARAERIGATAEIWCSRATDVPAVLGAIERLEPDLVVVDSVQTLVHPDAGGAAGSVAQVRESAAAVVRATKARGVACFLIGQATKDGAVAGPRMLEHLVDTVLWFEGERHGALRILRATKNRFGPAHESACFAMTAAGLDEVADPSRVLSGNRTEPPAGVAVAPLVEGTRPLLVEIQALVGTPALAAGRRTASGVEDRRLAVLLAVLERHAGVPLAGRDVFVATAGGVRVSEPAADLAIALAVASSFHGRSLATRTVALGEVGLSGEIRAVAQTERRVAEAARLGFGRVIVPAPAPRPPTPGVDLLPVRDVTEALEAGGRPERRDAGGHAARTPP